MSKVLVVPGDLIDRDLKGTLLDRRSAMIRTARNAEEAIAIADEWDPALIIFSSNISGKLDAVEFSTMLRRDPNRVTTRLLMLTDFIGESLGYISAAQVDAHLVSPVSQDQLMQTAALLLSVRYRRCRRAPLEVLTHLEGLTNATDRTSKTIANTIDISEIGMRLETSEHLVVGNSGTARLHLPGCNERLSLPCVVRVLLDEILLHYAVEFQSIDDDSREKIREFCSKTAEGLRQ